MTGRHGWHDAADDARTTNGLELNLVNGVAGLWGTGERLSVVQGSNVSERGHGLGVVRGVLAAEPGGGGGGGYGL